MLINSKNNYVEENTKSLWFEALTWLNKEVFSISVEKTHLRRTP
jgi:hypothetical protein